MKPHVLISIVAGLAFSSVADLTLLDDAFDNGVLGTGGVNGGFGVVGSGTGNVTEEAGGFAQITSSSNQNDVKGMLSSGTVSLSGDPGETAIKTRWVISNSDLKAKSSSLAFVWQTDSDITATPEIGVMLDLVNSNATLYVDNPGNVLGSIELHPDFGGSGDAFTLTAIFYEETFEVRGSNSLRQKNADNLFLAGNWGEGPGSTRDFSTDDYHVGALVNANGTAGIVVDATQVTVEAIPEPAVITMIGLFGSGFLVAHRLFGIT